MDDLAPGTAALIKTLVIVPAAPAKEALDGSPFNGRASAKARGRGAAAREEAPPLADGAGPHKGSGAPPVTGGIQLRSTATPEPRPPRLLGVRRRIRSSTQQVNRGGDADIQSPTPTLTSVALGAQRVQEGEVVLLVLLPLARRIKPPAGLIRGIELRHHPADADTKPCCKYIGGPAAQEPQDMKVGCSTLVKAHDNGKVIAQEQVTFAKAAGLSDSTSKTKQDGTQLFDVNGLIIQVWLGLNQTPLTIRDSFRV